MGTHSRDDCPLEETDWWSQVIQDPMAETPDVGRVLDEAVICWMSNVDPGPDSGVWTVTRVPGESCDVTSVCVRDISYDVTSVRLVT